jgi:opacity protein-like surface antigen
MGDPSMEGERFMKRLLMTMMVAAVFMAASAHAAPQGQLYASGNLAFGILTDAEDRGVDISFDPGWGILGALGYDMGQIRVEGEIGYRTFDIDSVSVPGLGVFPVGGDISALSIMANGYYDHDMGTALTPYAGFGLGFVDADVDVPGVGSSSGTELAYQLMLGAAYEISPKLALTGGYRFFGFTDNDGAYVHELNIGARFMF